jgi:hypothetical protein
MSRALSLAGFQVILIGRFWVTTEVKHAECRRIEHQRSIGLRDQRTILHKLVVRIHLSSSNLPDAPTV